MKNLIKVNNIDVSVHLGGVLDHDVDVIVNAANTALRSGGGLDGAIHKAAGPELLDHLIENYPNGCKTGEAVITPGFNLKQPYIVHVAGPRWFGGDKNEPDDLYNSYKTSLDRAAEVGAKSVALPSISTGIYGYPLEKASSVAVKAVIEWLNSNHNHSIEIIVFGMFKPEELEMYANTLKEYEMTERTTSKE